MTCCTKAKTGITPDNLGLSMATKKALEAPFLLGVLGLLSTQSGP